MSEEIITVRYEVWDHDITPHFLPPMPQIGICDVLSVTFQNGEWDVRSTEPGASTQWRGKAELRQEAILNYLKARLGWYEEKQTNE